MKRGYKVLAVIAACVGALAAPATGARDKTCIDGWSDAAPIVADKKLVNIEELSAKAPQKFGGSIIKATLCEKNGRFTYSLVVRTKRGKLKSVQVDARNPF